MKNYLVTWEMDIEADSAEDAAKQALAIQRDENSIATIFQVECLDGYGNGVLSIDVQESV